MNLYAIINTGLYGIPVVVGGIFFDKQPIIMTPLIIFGCILLAIKLNSDIQTTKARRTAYGYGDLR